MNLNKKGVVNKTAWESIVFGILGIAVAVGVFFLGKWLLVWSNAAFAGQALTTKAIEFPSGGFGDFLSSFLTVIFGQQASSWQGLLISIGFMFIVGVAMADILIAFSSFSPKSATAIGWGMALVAGAAGSYEGLYSLMLAQIALTGVAIFVLILVIIAEGIVVNIFFGSLLGRVRLARKIEQEANDTELGAEVAKNAIKGLGIIGEGLKADAKKANKKNP
jgi:hypothetical protein